MISDLVPSADDAQLILDCTIHTKKQDKSGGFGTTDLGERGIMQQMSNHINTGAHRCGELCNLLKLHPYSSDASAKNPNRSHAAQVTIRA